MRDANRASLKASLVVGQHAAARHRHGVGRTWTGAGDTRSSPDNTPGGPSGRGLRPREVVHKAFFSSVRARRVDSLASLQVYIHKDNENRWNIA